MPRKIALSYLREHEEVSKLIVVQLKKLKMARRIDFEVTIMPKFLAEYLMSPYMHTDEGDRIFGADAITQYLKNRLEGAPTEKQLLSQ